MPINCTYWIVVHRPCVGNLVEWMGLPGPLMFLSGILQYVSRQGPAQADLCNHEQQVGLDGVPSTANNFALKPLKPDPRQEKPPISAAYFLFMDHTHKHMHAHTNTPKHVSKAALHWLSFISWRLNQTLTITMAWLSRTFSWKEQSSQFYLHSPISQSLSQLYNLHRVQEVNILIYDLICFLAVNSGEDHSRVCQKT